MTTAESLHVDKKQSPAGSHAEAAYPIIFEVVTSGKRHTCQIVRAQVNCAKLPQRRPCRWQCPCTVSMNTLWQAWLCKMPVV